MIVVLIGLSHAYQIVYIMIDSNFDDCGAIRLYCSNRTILVRSQKMDALTANEAKTQFGDLLLKAQRAPIQINKNGKPVAVVISMDEYESLEALKLRLLQSRVAQAKADIMSGKLKVELNSSLPKSD